jgi:diaminopimelate decarboxylase
MATSSAGCTVSATQLPPRVPAAPVEAPIETLREVVRRYGTPTYAYDLGRIRSQVNKLRACLSPGVQVVYSLKANASLGLCSFLAGCGLGADVASAGELVTALEAGFPAERIFVSGPDKSPAMLAQLRSVPAALVSLDSVSELRLLAGLDRPHRALLRLRPDFSSFASCAAGPDSRFGLVAADLPACRPYLTSGGVRVVGFHVFAGSQVLDSAAIIHHLRGALDQALRAADTLGLSPEIIDLGGGFGVPYGPEDPDLDLAAVAGELRTLADRAAPARLMLELGRYFVAQAGWYLTTVIAQQTHQGRPAAVVDGGSHQRGDLCGLGLRHRAFAPVVLTGGDGPPTRTDVLGCLSLPGDVLAEASPLPALTRGDVLAFPNAGAYGLLASPLLFHGHPAPAEVAFAGAALEVIRALQPARSLLEGQTCLREIRASAVASG